MAAPKQPPQWIDPFLAALARTGNVGVSAEAAGVDVTNTYNRRARYPEFRDAWARVLGEREARAGGGGTALTLPLNCVERVPPSPAEGRGAVLELVPRTTATGVQLARVGTNRWSLAAEERFLVELGTSGNVKRAAAAAGFSEVAIYRRRGKQRQFAEAWDAAIENGRARVEALLVAAAERSFDLDAMPMPEEGAMPHVSVDQAIKIAQPRGGRAGAGKQMTWQEESEIGEAEVEAARENILRKLKRMGDRYREEKVAEGWTLWEDHLIPPGWVRAEGFVESGES